MGLAFQLPAGFHFIAVSESVHGYLSTLGIPRPDFLIHNAIEYAEDRPTGRSARLFEELGGADVFSYRRGAARTVKGHRYLFEVLATREIEAQSECLVGRRRLRGKYER